MKNLLYASLALLAAMVPGACAAQTVNTQQQVTLLGLRTANAHGSFTAAAYAPDGSLVLLLDEHDGIRVLKADGTATNLLAQTQLGATGDSALALSLDAAGNIYVTGTSSSGKLNGSSGAAFPAIADTSTNAYVAKFDTNLNLVFLTFLGAGKTSAASVSATSDAVFVTGTTYSTSLPVTAAGIQQAPAQGTSGNGFVERFNTTGTTLVYATYLTGAGGNTTPSAIVADSQDAAYVTGMTTASGLPTIAALQPQLLGSTSGFLLKLTPAGNTFTFSTFVAGAGISGLALDARNTSLLLSGNVALGQFPVATVAAPLTSAGYQSLLRIPLDGQSVTASVLLVPGTQSFVSTGTNGDAWISGSLSTPLFPGAAPPNYNAGDSFLVHLTAANAIDQTQRFGGLPINHVAYSSLTSTVAAPAVSAAGTFVMVPGTLTANVAKSLLGSQRFDLPLTPTPGAVLPNVIHDLLPTVAACGTSSVCTGNGALLAGVSAGTGAPSLALSIDDLPNVTLRNLGSVSASGLAASASGYTVGGTCGTSLDPSGSCSLLLQGSGPGSLTVTASNATTVTATLPTNTAATDTLVLSTGELDFGIVSPVASRTITVTNVSTTTQTFTSAKDGGPTTAYNLAEAGSDCGSGGATGVHTLAASSSCHIALQLTTASSSANDGAVQANWLIGPRDVAITGFAQAQPLNLSAQEIDFGLQFSGTNAIHLPRYLYLSNNGSAALAHNLVATGNGSPFTVTDGCPSVLEPRTVCQLRIDYASYTAPSSDSTVLSLDQGYSVTLTGTTRAPASINSSTANPSLTVSTNAVTFPTPVIASGVSGTTQSVTLTNTGSTGLPLAFAISGDFTDTSGCPATLGAGDNCTLLLGFTPSQPGLRSGLLSVTAGSGFAPALITLAGTGSAILPANNGVLDLGQTLLGEPTVLWLKVQQSLPSLSVSSGNPLFGVAIVAETGSGHGSLPAGAFNQNISASCGNCWLGIQFFSQTAGIQTGLLSLTTTTGGKPYQVTVTGNALPVQGLVVTPLTPDFGPVAINSASAPMLFTLANLLPNGTGTTVQSVQATGDFNVVTNASGGQSCSGALAATTSCFVEVAFSPTATGTRSGTLSITTSSGVVSVTLTGFGEPDPGIAINPTALNFLNTPSSSATSQTITLSNTGPSALIIGTVTTGDPSFTTSSNCGTLNAGSLCTVTVNFMPQPGEIFTALSVPVTMTINGQTSTVAYSIPLSGEYAAPNAALQILADEVNYGATATGNLGATRTYTLNNLSAKALNITFQLPRQFVLASSSPCTTIAANGTCSFAASFLPAESGAATGTLFAQGVASDGTTAQALAYQLGYGSSAGSLAITGNLVPNSPLSFGQVNSGQSASQTLTVTNTGTTAVSVRRILTEPPFYATNTCGAALAPAANCQVTIRYAPIDEIAANASSALARSDLGSVIVESDAASSPDAVSLSGTAVPVVSSSPATSSALNTYALSNSALTFSNVAIGGTSSAVVITFTNTGTVPLHVQSVLAPADFPASTTCATQLPGSSCTISVSFAPTTASTATVRTGAIEISSDAATSLEYISVIGTSSSAPLTLNPTALNFGTVSVGAAGTLQVNVTNTTAAPVTFMGLSATGDYSVVKGSCPAVGSSLPANATCTLTATFTPTSTGTRTGTLSLSSNATQTPLTVSLTGNAVQSQLTVAPGALAFGSIAQGATATLTLQLTNTGTAPVNGISTLLSGAGAAAYAVTVPCASQTLAPNQTCTVAITFTPTALGAFAATLTVTSSDPKGPATISITGSSVAAGSFVLTANGGATATVTVNSGSPATYALLLTPQNGYTGPVALTCTPVVAAPDASCSLLASALTLSGAATASSTATISTIVSSHSQSSSVAGGALAGLLLAPLALLLRKKMPKLAVVLLLTAASCGMVAMTGCGGGTSAGTTTSGPTTISTPAGSYKYQVTASSTSGAVVSSTVTLNLIVQ